jgi:hypothetical protein
MTDSESLSLGHETDEGNVRAIVLAAIGFAIGIVLTLLFVYGIFRYFNRIAAVPGSLNPMAETDRAQIPPSPRIEEYPARELEDLHAREQRILSTYGWTDKAAGIVRIPIDRAMELQLERGFPVRRPTVTK